ncbi:probable het-c2 protein [Phaffia rhodozyma]|uniref:Probable het-c2 protein n=1 Tax=Phaffia rhodozyma TaxID=264483 RepID=A0A0F7SK21_PHARH|nr:probable het-c2 protein [Phaffia rhodozyma]
MSSPQFFETIPVKFQDVSTTPGIDTASFCQASEGLVKIFDVLGNAAFTPVKSDITGNIKKVQDRLAASPGSSATLQSLVQNEGKPGDKNRTATQGLLWLIRGLKFNATALRHSLSNPSDELTVSFTKSYESTLKQYHSMFVRPVFALAMKACPYRKDFYAKLGSPQDVVEKELDQWLSALEKIIKEVEDFYAAGNWAKGF